MYSFITLMVNDPDRGELRAVARIGWATFFTLAAFPMHAVSWFVTLLGGSTAETDWARQFDKEIEKEKTKNPSAVETRRGFLSGRDIVESKPFASWPPCVRESFFIC
jgi:hypothetical protein